jgi:2,4-dichlorophenol 6-monooxygenase
MTFKNTAVLNAALQFVPGQKEANLARLAALLEHSETGATHRAQLRHVFSAQATEFSALDLELGFSYWQGGAHISDGTEKPEFDPLGQKYIQTSRPGHRLPHVWLEIDGDRSGEVLSTHDLMQHSYDYLLITDHKGTVWVDAVQEAARNMNLSIGVAQIGPLEAGLRPCKYIDREDRWPAESGLREGGAILVRPDNFVAWRQRTGSLTAGSEVVAALGVLVGSAVGQGPHVPHCHANNSKPQLPKGHIE